MFDTMKYSNSARDMSLIEQKKLQWAKEKEEMSKLNELFAATTTTRQFERTSIRTYYSNVDLTSNFHSDTLARKQNYYSEANAQQKHQLDTSGTNSGENHMNNGVGYYHVSDNLINNNNVSDDSTHHCNERVRSPSLPPIGHHKIRMKQAPSNTSQQQTQSMQMNTDEDTSGYLSDGRTSPTIWTAPHPPMERNRPRMRLPNEHRSKKSSHFIPPKPDFDDFVDSASSELQHTPFDKHKVNKHTEGGKRSYKNEYYNNLSKYGPIGGEEMKAMQQQTNEMANSVKGTSSGVGIGQGRKLPPGDGIDDNEHETDFSIPKTPSSISSDASHDYSRLSSYQNMGCRKDKEERAKWVDRNAALGHLYDPVSKGSSIKSGPCWLERGFPDSGDESVRSYSFIRGQNAPIDPTVLAERASRRMKALEFQNAIKEQLEERERFKQMEHERRLLEERRYEDRVRQQLEAEQQHAEEEHRKQKEKLENEHKRQEMMKIAIEKARQEAEIEKARKKRETHPMAQEESHIERIDRNRPVEYDEINQMEKMQAETTNRSNFRHHQETTTDTPRSQCDTNSDQSTPDDGEKILIGSPIKLKKKTVSKVKKTPAKLDMKTNKDSAPQTDIDGIALVLQTLPPIVPILSNDIMNLNQNINNLNNIQLAVMLAHQMQQLNSITAQNQLPDHMSNKSLPLNVNETKPNVEIISPHQTLPMNEAKSQSDQCNNIKSFANESKEFRTDANCVRCDICGKKQKNKSESKLEFSENDLLQDVTLPTDPPANIKANVKDAATATSDIEDLNSNIEQIDIGTEVFSGATSLIEFAPFVDAATQTVAKTEFEYCFQCRFHQCHQHHVIVKDLPLNDNEDMHSIALNHLIVKNKCVDKECALAVATGRQKTNGETKFELKEIREPIKLEDRPKWGVNRPIQQYVKASERDPFYIRNKRKKHKKRQLENAGSDHSSNGGFELKEDSTIASRSSSPSPSIITNSTVILSSPTLSKTMPNRKTSKRNICTEILPIKTDMNGRVYLNFRESSVTMSENEARQNLKNRYNKMNRIMNRCRTTDDILGDSSIDIDNHEIDSNAVGANKKNRSNIKSESL